MALIGGEAMPAVRAAGASAPAASVRLRIEAAGVVQGVGMRPFVAKLASRLGLAGFVGNDPDGVFIEVEGAPDAVAQFRHALDRPEQLPPLARLERLGTAIRPATGQTGFTIAPSRVAPVGAASASGPISAPRPAATGDAPAAISIPADAATCADCLAELSDPADRRYRYPFIACTQCGPRFTIVARLPYDRPGTVMADFPLCPQCAAEYTDPMDRRFHAQPQCCPSCGPQLSLRSAGGFDPPPGMPALAGVVTGTEAVLQQTLAVLAVGGIVAIKGTGGYHLAVDATRPNAVARLRRRKRRSDKAFAVMAPDAATARRLADFDDDAMAALSGPAAPIVLADARADGPLSPAARAAIAPGLDTLGVMLPSTGLHHLLFRTSAPVGADTRGRAAKRADGAAASFARDGAAGWRPRVLVFTSANRADCPIIIDDQDAFDGLADIADAILAHNRRILLPCDDSVLAAPLGLPSAPASPPTPVRRSRGIVPGRLRITAPAGAPTMLAVGGEMKATVALAFQDRSGRAGELTVQPSAHIGDTASTETLATLERAVDHLVALSGRPVELVLADPHPGYRSRAFAESYARARDVECRYVQHHHAHFASLAADAGLPPDQPMLGFAFDGTGYGLDGAIWGGEVLAGTAAGPRRVAHLRQFLLPGGEAAIRHPARIALSLLDGFGLAGAADRVAGLADDERAAVRSMLAASVHTVPTTSMGRLFDAVSALLGVCLRPGYEGEAAMRLEAHAKRGLPRLARGAARVGHDIGTGYEWAFPRDGDALVLDPAPALAAICDELASGVATELIAARFHLGLAGAIATTARMIVDAMGASAATLPVGLAGGVFANRLLVTATRRRLAAVGLGVLTHRRLPPNDGGLAVGQIFAAAGRGA
ncbi:MAG: carbamoyltransferase HypF [Actinomycetia bacterium]|nr:carbamoyltransferase HypF [Actinomycetes bacterium]